MDLERPILHFEEINDLHAATGFAGRTDLRAFHIHTQAETYPQTRTYMPPYTVSFYTIVLLRRSDDAELELNTNKEPGGDLLAFQAPGNTAAWVRGEQQRGLSGRRRRPTADRAADSFGIESRCRGKTLRLSPPLRISG